MNKTIEQIEAEIAELKAQKAALIKREELTLTTLQKIYPPKRGTGQVVGLIPIDEYYRLEEEISAVIVKERLQRFYRGPRRYSKSTRTLKADATGLVLNPK